MLMLKNMDDTYRGCYDEAMCVYYEGVA